MLQIQHYIQKVCCYGIYVEVDLMLKNNWINPMHTKVPGNDGQLSYGGKCFPKDTKALVKLGDKVGINLSILKTIFSSLEFSIILIN